MTGAATATRRGTRFRNPTVRPPESVIVGDFPLILRHSTQRDPATSLPVSSVKGYQARSCEQQFKNVPLQGLWSSARFFVGPSGRVLSVVVTHCHMVATRVTECQECLTVRRWSRKNRWKRQDWSGNQHTSVHVCVSEESARASSCTRNRTSRCSMVVFCRAGR